MVKILQTIREYLALAQMQKELSKFFPTFSEQKQWLKRFRQIDDNVPSAHNASHIIKFMIAALRFPPDQPGCIVEAGAYKGAGTCKLSLIAKHLGRKLYVFDSFRGLPPNEEHHDRSLEGHFITDWFREGNFAGSLEEVKMNVSKYGSLSNCVFVPGWFEETMPSFNESIAMAYLDVDLAASTRTCLRYLFPLLDQKGAIFSQDGDFPLVVDVFQDASFWQNLGYHNLPSIENLGKKITVIRKAS